MIKKYQSKVYLFLSTPITINGKTTRIRFEGGRELPNRTIMGWFKTNDPEVQKALESSPAFNRSFELVEAIPEPSDVIVDDKKPDPVPPVDPVVTDPVPPAATEQTLDPDADSGEEGDTLNPEDVTKMVEAKTFMNKMYSIPFAKMGNVDAILKIAEEKGVTFPNWESAKSK